MVLENSRSTLLGSLISSGSAFGNVFGRFSILVGTAWASSSEEPLNRARKLVDFGEEKDSIVNCGVRDKVHRVSEEQARRRGAPNDRASSERRRKVGEHRFSELGRWKLRFEPGPLGRNSL